MLIRGYWGSDFQKLTVIVTTDGPEIRIADSSATRIFFTQMMQHLAHKLTTRFHFHLLFCVAEKKNSEVLVKKKEKHC